LGFVHHSRNLFCRAVPNPNLTIRNFSIAVLQAEVQLVVVGTLRRVLTLVPAASSALLPLLLRRVPHKRLPAATHCLFLESLFALAEAEEGRPLREEMLLGVVDVLLQVQERERE
jgi:hypothetical protein